MYIYRNISAYTHGIALAYVHILLCTQTHATVYCLSFYIPGNLGKNKPLICATISFHFMQFPLIIIEHHIASRWYRALPNCKLLNEQCVYHYSIARKSMFSRTHRRCLYFNSQYVFAHARALCKEGEPCKEATRSFAETWDLNVNAWYPGTVIHNLV